MVSLEFELSTSLETIPMSMWTGRELERGVAAKMTEAGCVCLLNPKEDQTQVEMDIYALRFSPAAVRRAIVECKTGRFGNNDILALAGLLQRHPVDQLVLAARREPHKDQAATCRTYGVELIVADRDSSRSARSIIGTPVDLAEPLGYVGKAVRSTHRCISALERIALDRTPPTELSQMTGAMRQRVTSTILTHDPIRRLTELFAIHNESPRLSQECAWEEQLGPNRELSLKYAYGFNRGTYTQTALMLQTLNRVFAVVAAAEAAIEGLFENVEIDVSALPPRTLPIIEWLSKQDFRDVVGPFLYQVVFVFGGFWPLAYQNEVWSALGDNIGADPSIVPRLVQMVNHLFRAVNRPAFREVPYQGLEWTNFTLCPFALKGIGCRSLQALGCVLKHAEYDKWLKAADDLEEKCRQYEKAH